MKMAGKMVQVIPKHGNDASNESSKKWFIAEKKARELSKI